MDSNEDLKKLNKEIINREKVKFDNTINELNDKFILKKNNFLNHPFKVIYTANSKNFSNSDVIELYKYNFVIMFSANDKDVTEKLKNIKYPERLLKRRADLNDIVKEIEKLTFNYGYIIFPSKTLSSIVDYFFFYYMLLFFEYYSPESSTPNNTQSKILHDIKNLGRKLERHFLITKKENFLNKLENHELLIFKEFDKMLNLQDFDDLEKKNILKFSPLKFMKEHLKNIQNIKLNGKSMNQFYIDLFPLLKSFIFDKELLDEETFKNRDTHKYDNSYRNYKLSRVKSILGIS